MLYSLIFSRQQQHTLEISQAEGKAAEYQETSEKPAIKPSNNSRLGATL
jgi:hypothetical protein